MLYTKLPYSYITIIPYYLLPGTIIPYYLLPGTISNSAQRLNGPHKLLGVNKM